MRVAVLVASLLLARLAAAQPATLPLEVALPPPPPDVASPSFIGYEGREVPPLVGKASARDYLFVGSIDAGERVAAILSTAAWIPSGANEGGTFGLLLVPDAAFAREALDREGTAPLSLSVKAPVGRSPGVTIAESTAPLPLGFPRWRAYLFNTTSSTIKMSAYVRLLER